MNIKEFKQRRIEERKKLLEKIIDTFKSLNPVAIHQFGSGGSGFKDEFSDIDIWITFKDSEIDAVLKKLDQILEEISPVLIKHHSESWSPIGGSSNSVIHDTDFGPIVVDYYISKLSETAIKEDAVVVFGDDSLKRGEWRLNNEFNKEVKDSHNLKRDTSLLIDLLFISIKGIVRKWDNEDFINNFKRIYKLFKKEYKLKIKRRVIRLDFKSYQRLLSDLHEISDENQRVAIKKIIDYIKQVDSLYLN